MGRQVIEAAYDKTNLISYSALKYAERGEARESIGLLMDALFTGNKKAVEQGLLHVMEIGSSSGTEISWGILNGLQLMIRQ